MKWLHIFSYYRLLDSKSLYSWFGYVSKTNVKLIVRDEVHKIGVMN